MDRLSDSGTPRTPLSSERLTEQSQTVAANQVQMTAPTVTKCEKYYRTQRLPCSPQQAHHKAVPCKYVIYLERRNRRWDNCRRRPLRSKVPCPTTALLVQN